MVLPIKHASDSTSKDGDIEVWCESQNDHAHSGTCKSSHDDWLTSNTITDLAPHGCTRELSEGERRSDHSSINSDLFVIVGHIEGLNHVVDVRKDRHEGNGLANAAETCLCVR